jgi:CheY-like chemotaxis protein
MEDAMNKASDNLYDFVIMDINLGGDDTGIDVTRELRTLDGYSNVPIIAVTAYAMKGDKKFFVNSGLDAYVSKPFTRNELILTIKRCLNSFTE